MNIFKQILSFLRNLRINRGKMNAATALLVALVTSSNYVVADSRQQTADSRQQTADSRQQTADKMRNLCGGGCQVKKFETYHWAVEW